MPAGVTYPRVLATSRVKTSGRACPKASQYRSDLTTDSGRFRGPAASGGTYRDRSGRALVDYPRPSVAVDTALLTLVPDGVGWQPSVLEVRRTEGRGWALPGTFLHEGERLIDAVLRSLRDKAGVIGLQLRQLQVFDDPRRDDRGWVLSVAHLDAVSVDVLHDRFPDASRLVPVAAPGVLPYGHLVMIALAVHELRERYRALPDPTGFLGETFTLRDLRFVHEALAGGQLQRDTFRRAMDPFLAPTGAVDSGRRGRPAE